jgi:hypothetical protein
MTPTHTGALQIVRESFAFLSAAIEDLPQEALEWKPLETANSVSVLVMHTITATRFFLKAGCGEVGSIVEYRKTERADAFRTAGVSKDELKQRIADFLVEAEQILATGGGANLEQTIEMQTGDGLPVPTRNGAGSLFAAIGHLREHVGHVQLMHDLWLAGKR